jgi:AcrR family transcriptional regulator
MLVASYIVPATTSLPNTRSTPRRYHHGNLRAALIGAGLEVLAETGVAGFSVAHAAKLADVSSAAPYRHFADRAALLAACAAAVASRLLACLQEAATEAGKDPVKRLAATAGAYARFVVEHHVGIELIYAPELAHGHHEELKAASRRLIDLLLGLALTVSAADTYADTMDLLEAHLASAHGLATLHLQHGLARRHDVDEISRRATRLSVALIAGYPNQRP